MQGLVQAMASFSPPAMTSFSPPAIGQTPLFAEERNNLSQAIAANGQ